MADDPIARAVALLNDALRRDPKAVTDLVTLRVPCNQALADLPTLQTALVDGGPRLGVLGLLNALLGDRPGGVIGARGTTGAGGRFRIVEFVDLRDGRVDLRA